MRRTGTEFIRVGQSHLKQKMMYLLWIIFQLIELYKNLWMLELNVAENFHGHR